MNNFSEKLNEFDQKFSNLEKIDNTFYENLWVNVWQNINTKTKDTKWWWSEEYIRARFVYAMIYSWMFQKEFERNSQLWIFQLNMELFELKEKLEDIIDKIIMDEKIELSFI